MSRFEDCVNATVKAGNVGRAHARQVLEDFQNAKARGLDDLAAATEASAADLLRAEAGKARTAQQIIKQTAAMENAAGHKRGITAGTRAVMSYDPWNLAGYESVEGVGRAMTGIMHAKFAQGIEFLKSKTLGVTANIVSARAFVREFFGEATGDTFAAGASKAWKETDQYGVKMRRNEGSNLAETLPDYLPQAWNDRAVQRMGKPEFNAWMMARWDDGRLKMIDFETGNPVSRDKALTLIDNAYDTIASNGMNKMKPGQQGSKMLANAHSDRRVFHWTGADAWLDFNKTFGYGDGGIFESLMGHISGVAREYALLRVMGPNPDSTARALVDTARQGGANGLQTYHLESVYDQVTGRAQSPVSEWLARWGGSVAAWLRSAQLGSAALSAAGDFATLSKTADWMGLSKTKVISRYLELMNPSATGGRQHALRSALAAENVARSAQMTFRDGLEFGVHGTANKFADVVMKASLLSPHTAAARNALGLEILSHLTQLSKQNRAFDNLPGPIARAFERHGISEADWTLMKTGVRDMGGVDWLHPEALAKSAEGEGQGVAIRLMSMVNREMDMAAPIGGAFERALLQGKSRPGSLVFEFLVRPIAMYKTYPLSIITHHGFRMASTALEEGWGAGAAYASLFVTLTAAGAFALQAKSISQGKDPMEMSRGKFWALAAFQGGGLGIFGDYLNSGLNRADKSFFASLAGPQWGLVDDVARLTGANITAVAKDKDTHAGRELANLARRYTPGTSLWYTRLALDRLVWDSLQKELDADYPKSFRRIEERAKKEFGQSMWWGPGRTEPTREPNLGAAVR